MKNSWRNRIVGQGVVDPKKIATNPANWRTHPADQREALQAVMKRVGWVQRVVINKTTGNLVDGHLRVEEAIASGEGRVPVTYVDLTEQEEREILAVLDPLSALATTDDEQMRLLLDSLVDRDGMNELLEKILDVEITDESVEFAVKNEETVETTNSCPKCGYRW